MADSTRPASFMLNNSKGHPDFVMTMLVAVTLAMFLVVLFWMLLNVLAFRAATDADSSKYVFQMLESFNENARMIVLGFGSSVFSLAGAYFLRRYSYDKHFQERERTRLEFGADVTNEGDQSGFQPIEESTLQHRNYDDEEEDI